MKSSKCQSITGTSASAKESKPSINKTHNNKDTSLQLQAQVLPHWVPQPSKCYRLLKTLSSLNCHRVCLKCLKPYLASNATGCLKPYLASNATGLPQMLKTLSSLKCYRSASNATGLQPSNASGVHNN